ncbi:hypothetical protein [Paenibacillus sp. y28]|uniref:hypothetical protein n=1 Tax=Paenibacillus sp. y28 TaxID=3129110 RepID=UPI00301A37F1
MNIESICSMTSPEVVKELQTWMMPNDMVHDVKVKDEGKATIEVWFSIQSISIEQKRPRALLKIFYNRKTRLVRAELLAPSDMRAILTWFYGNEQQELVRLQGIEQALQDCQDNPAFKTSSDVFDWLQSTTGYRTA